MKRYLFIMVLATFILGYGKIQIDCAYADETTKTSQDVPAGLGSQEKKGEAQTDKFSVTLNDRLTYFHAGHQMYVHIPLLEKLSALAAEFFGASASRGKNDQW